MMHFVNSYACVCVLFGVVTITGMAEKFDLDSLIVFHKILSQNAFNFSSIAAEGNVGDFAHQVETYYNETKLHSPRTICEVGFNAGHSAATFLFSSPITTSYLGL